MTQVTVRPSEEVLADPALRAVLTALLAPSWRDPEALLQSELEKTSKVLVASSDGEVLAFSTWACKTLIVQGKQAAAAYIGLSSVAEGAKGQGLGSQVVMGAMRRSRDEVVTLHGTLADPHPCSPLTWGTTCSPVSYYGLRRAFPDFQPTGEAVSPEVAAMFEGIADALGAGTSDPERPFLVRGATEARYSDREAARLAAALQERPVPLLASVDAGRGDRLLMVFHSGYQASAR